MYHPTTRVLAVLELLQTHGRMRGADMAERLGVDARTLRRYIVTLEEIGIPITTERGRHGGYALMPGFKLPPLMFSEDEALALSIGLLAARSLGFAEARRRWPVPRPSWSASCRTHCAPACARSTRPCASIPCARWRRRTTMRW